MELHLALKEILSNNKNEYTNVDRFLDILADYQCFENARYLRGIIRDMIEDGYIECIHKILFIDYSADTKLMDAISKFKTLYAYRDDIIVYVTECFLYGWDRIYNVNEIEKITSLEKVQESFRWWKTVYPAPFVKGLNKFNSYSSSFDIEVFSRLAIGTIKREKVTTIEEAENIINWVHDNLMTSASKGEQYFLTNRSGTKLFAGDTDISGIVRIPNGVEEIMDGSFKNCRGITEVYMPDTVKFIGMSAFSGCWNLKTIHFSKNLVKINDNAFSDVFSLEEIKLPETLEYIGEGAFEGSCICIEQPAIPINIKAISAAFRFEKLNIGEEHKYLFNFDGAIYSSDMKHLYMFLNTKKKETFILSDNVRWIHAYAFSNSHIKEVVLNSAIKKIGNNAFEHSDIERIVIPDSLKFLLDDVFAGCECLKDIYFESEDLKLIAEDAFNGFSLKRCTLHVKKSALETAKEEYPFCNFGRIMSY